MDVHATPAVVLLAMMLAACGGRSALDAGTLSSSDPNPNPDANPLPNPNANPLPNPNASPNPGNGNRNDNDNLGPARAKLYVHIGGFGEAEGPTCPVLGYDTYRPVGNSPFNYEGYVIDGEDGAQVSCRVSGGPRFEVEAKLVAEGIEFGVADLTMFNGKGVDNGVGTMTFTDPAQLLTALSAPTCDFETEFETVGMEPGSIQAGFRCDALVSAEGFTCHTYGGFTFENCDRY